MLEAQIRTWESFGRKNGRKENMNEDFSRRNLKKAGWCAFGRCREKNV